jgi:glycosyltransferase involved in cell wall biosynthesis
MSDMKIAFDLRNIELGPTGGLTQLMQGILAAALARDAANEYLLFCTPANYNLVDGDRPNLRRVTLPYHSYHTELEDHLRFRGDVDVLFRSYPCPDLGYFPLERQIVCIPDLQHEAHPEFFERARLRERRQMFHHFQSGAGAIATISEFTRDQLRADPWTRTQDIFLMPPSLPLGHASATENDLTESERRLLPVGPFFLFPANIWPHKNHRRVLEAYERFGRRRGRGVPFLFTGNTKGWDEIAHPYRHLPIRHLGFVRAEFLSVLYRRAIALLYLTLFEGFGIPLLEAFAAGTPVVCSDITSLPEVAGDAALTCTPTDPDAMSRALDRIADDDALRRQLVAHGMERLAYYSWDASADALIAACWRVAERTEPAIEVWTPPTVSIVTPSFEQGHYIRRTIDSVLGQDYPHIDYRVVDGGSTDDTVDILKSYGDRFPWVSEKDNGQTHAINKGLTAATGQIRAYLNSDDLLRPGAVGRMVEQFRRHPDCDLLYGHGAMIDENDELIQFYPSKLYTFENLMETCCISQPSAFWTKRITDLIGPFDENYQFAMDYNYWLRIERAGGRLLHVDDLWSSTRMHAATKSLGGSRERIFAEIWRTCMEHGEYVSWSVVTSWLQLCLEPRRPWTHHFRWLLARTLFAYYRYTGRTAAKPSIPAWLLRKAYALFRKVPGSSLVTSLLPRRAGPPVGYRHDNWLSPECRFYPKRRGPGEAIRLVGEAPVPMKLVVWHRKQPLATYDLAGGTVTELTLPVPEDASPKEPVVLRFSEHIPAMLDRFPVSFRVLGTNLFSEHEVG